MNTNNIIAILGGTFDPPHQGHLQISQRVIEKKLANEVIFVPVARPPHKLKKFLESPAHRYAMVESMVADNDKLAVSDYEIVNKRQASYSYHTLRAFQAVYPSKKIKLIIGADNLLNFNSWYKVNDILQNFELIIFQRQNTEKLDLMTLKSLFNQRIAKKMLENIVEFDCDISSTKVRQAITEKRSYSSLVTKEVFAYIIENNLYGSLDE